VLSRIGQWCVARGREIGGLDLRSLGLMRIFLGVILLVDLAVRSMDLRTFYSDAGVLPRHVVLEGWQYASYVSVHMISGHHYFQGLLFLISAAAALSFTFGYRTRLMGFLSWFLLCSLHIRNPIVLSGGDIVLRQILFWCLFLPLSARYSLDALLAELEEDRPRKGQQPLFFSLASACLIIQMAVIYVVSALFKTGDSWADGSAVYYAINVDYLVEQPQASIVLQYPELMEWLTHATMVVEFWVPFLLLVPFFSGPIRTLVCLQFAVLHLSFYGLMALGIFPWVCIVGWVGLLPGWFWDRTRLREVSATPRPRLRSGWGTHGLAMLALVGMVQWNLATLPEAEICPPEFEEDGPWCIGSNPDEIYIDVAKRGSCPEEYEDLGEFCEQSEDPPFHYIENLYDHCPPTYEEVGEYCRTAMDQSTLATHKAEVSWSQSLYGRPLDDWLEPWSRMLKQDQKWNMFSPNPLRADGWWVIPGQLVDGSEVELLHGGAVSWDKPDQISETFPNQRWRKFLPNLALAAHKKRRVHYGRMLCRDWNEESSGDDRLATLQMIYMQEVTPPPDEKDMPVEIEKVVLWKHKCF
jgi:hypothetical protein